MKWESNFLLLSNDKLIKLIDFLGYKSLTDNTKMISIYEDDIIIEKKWDYYETLSVKPTEITASGNGSMVVLFTSNKFDKLVELFTDENVKHNCECQKSPNGKHEYVPSPDSFDLPYCKYCYKS